MSKLSKKFRQLKAVKFLMDLRKTIFHKLPFYSSFRSNIMIAKWKLKFALMPRYKAPKNRLAKYHNLRVFRPESTFSEFDIALTANSAEFSDKLFIQILTKAHCRSKGKSYDTFSNSFTLKNKIYQKVINEVAKVDAKIAQTLIEPIELDSTDSKFTIFVTKFKEFEPFYKIVENKKLSDEEKEILIKKIKFFEKIFNKCQIFWVDATPHNVMTISGTLEIVPVDYANNVRGTQEQVEGYNKFSASRLIDYINSGSFSWPDNWLKENVK